MDSSGSEQGQVKDPCEESNELTHSLRQNGRLSACQDS